MKRFALAAAAALLLTGCAHTPAPVSERVAAAYATGTAVPTMTAIPDAPVVAFLGDSYVEGSRMDIGKQFPDLLSTKFGWDQVMLGEGGSGYTKEGNKGTTFADRAPLAIGPDVDMVVVSGGYNDSAIWSLTQNSQAILGSIRHGMPKTKMVVLSNFVPSGNPSERDIQKRDILADSAERVGATFIDVTALFKDRHDLIGADKTHPTDAGHQFIAEYLATRLPKVTAEG